jgi:XRE family transcriptional regulator of biofilm formation
LGERIRYLRSRRVLTLQELAERAGIAKYQTISAIEKGLRQPRPSTLRKIAAALDVEPSALLPDEPDESA